MKGDQASDVIFRGPQAAKCAHAFTRERVVQQHSRGCGLACVAMATAGAASYDEVANRARERGWLSDIIREGCPIRRLRLLLRDFGIESSPAAAFNHWNRTKASLAIVLIAWPKCPETHYMLYECIRVGDAWVDRLLDPLQRMPTGTRWDVRKVIPRMIIRLR